jgi:hypothetical protein
LLIRRLSQFSCPDTKGHPYARASSALVLPLPLLLLLVRPGETAASNRKDSAVFLSLPNLKSQSKENFVPVPLGFGEEVQRAEKDKDARKLTLLGLETDGFPWKSTGLRNVGRAQLLIKRYGAAKTAWESLRKLDDFDLEANTALGNIYQRLDDLTSSSQALDRALQDFQ